MSAAEVARLMHGKKFGKTWRARCPVHGSRKGRRDAVSITQMHDGVRVHCFGGCSAADVIKAVGLKWRDLRNEEASPAVRAHTSLQQMKEDLTAQWQSARMMVSLEPEKRNYWKAVERNTYRDLQLVRCRLEPETVYRELRGRQWEHMNLSQREKAIERAYELFRTANGAAGGQNDLRQVRVD